MADQGAIQPTGILNPYASPSIVDDRSAPRGDWSVDGNCIVATSGTSLPQRCIFTGQQVTPSDRRRCRLDWTPTFRLVLRPRSCYLSYCVNREHRHRQYRNRIVLAAIAMLVAWLLLGKEFSWVLIFIPVVSAAVPLDNVRAVAYRDGRFWITGFSRAFLAACEQELAENQELLSPKVSSPR